MGTRDVQAAVKNAVPLPTGTVTFLFTDIEGSTQRWEAQREAMQAAARRHDELLRTVIQNKNRYVFKTVGDSFCAAFDAVADAINAAIEAQQALTKEDFKAVGGLPVRMALHTGGSEEREGDYFGPTVNRVSRLLSVGHGGQILLSDATNALARSELPPRCSLRDLGSHRLKDLSNPEHVFQLVAPDLPVEFAPLRPLDAVPNNLPLQLTSFRGREMDVRK
jgi:class 3 adenylate cyclase